MHKTPGPSISPEVVTRAVWDAVKEIPGLHDLYRNPLQTLGERVHLDRRGPVRLESDESGSVLEIHVVADADTNIARLGNTVAQTGARYLERITGTMICRVEVHVDDIAAPEP